MSKSILRFQWFHVIQSFPTVASNKPHPNLKSILKIKWLHQYLLILETQLDTPE